MQNDQVRFVSDAVDVSSALPFAASVPTSVNPLQCSRCGGDLQWAYGDGTGFTVGYYVRASWEKFFNEGERFLCDTCMQKDPRYIEVYGLKPFPGLTPMGGQHGVPIKSTTSAEPPARFPDGPSLTPNAFSPRPTGGPIVYEMIDTGPTPEQVVVDHPSHYHAESGIEVIDAIEAWGLGFNLGNCVKYVARCGYKGDRLVDLQKALWYLKREIANIEKDREGKA